MRILFVTASSGSHGGGELFFVSLANQISSKGHDVGFWASSHQQMDPLLELLDEKSQILRSPYTNTYHHKLRSLQHLFPDRSCLRTLHECWSTFAPEIIHINKQCLEDGLDLLEAADALETPSCCTIHITQSARQLKANGAWLRDWVAKTKLRRYKGRLMATAKPRARELGKVLQSSEPAPLVLNGVHIPSLKEVTQTGAQTLERLTGSSMRKGPVAVSVGRLEEQKDPLKFVELMVAWKASAPGLTAYWVGDGQLREAFENKIHYHQAGDWIQCLGWQKDPFPYLCMADAYIHPARFEGLPFSLLEAMARGKPCVLLNRLAKDLEDIPLSTWILADDVPRMVTLLNDPECLDHFACKTRKLAEQTFSNEAMANQYLNAYNVAISNFSNPSPR